MSIACVIGARPNLVKIAPIVREMRRRRLDYTLIHTGQHYDHSLSGKLMEELDIPAPDLNLGVGSKTHAQQTAEAMVGLETEWLRSRPAAVLAVGDVNSTLAAAMVAAKLNIRLIHLEAGYRSFDRGMPEEVNRVVVDHLSDVLLAPTADAVDNLAREGIDPLKVHLVGNIMAQTLLEQVEALDPGPLLTKLGLGESPYAVATIHRPENTDEPHKLAEIIQAFSAAPIDVILPLHPRTSRRIADFGLEAAIGPRLTTVDPLSYVELLGLMKESELVLTDSGGVQEEACLLNVPCLTIRKNTERVATVLVGANKLIRGTTDDILTGIGEWLDSPRRRWDAPPLWDGQVSQRVIDIIEGQKLSTDHKECAPPATGAPAG